jgi:2,3-bisphosphoglycerate-dependent phosphoglycerate mutase
MMMELVLIRHGESLGNALKGESAVYTGRWDCNLTERGYQQAISLIGTPILENIDAWYSSNLIRTIETAKTITDRDIIVDQRLQERSLGEFEGLTIESVKKDPRYIKYFTDPEFMQFRNSFTVKAPGGENYGDVCERVRDFLQELASKDYKKVAIVTHHCVIRCIVKILNNLSEEETLSFKVNNCEPISVQLRDDALH